MRIESRAFAFTSKTLRAFPETIQTHILHESKLHAPNSHSNHFLLLQNSAIHAPSIRTLFIHKIYTILEIIHPTKLVKL